MGNKYFHSKRMSNIQRVIWQLRSIRNTYSNIESSSHGKDSLTCVMKITPSEHSDTYTVEISYRCGERPQAKLLSHTLEKRDGKYPHHIFGFDKKGHAKLCVFHSKTDGWNQDTLISETFIPWVSTWLNTYEYWLITGAWHYSEVFIGKDGKIKGGDTK